MKLKLLSTTTTHTAPQRDVLIFTVVDDTGQPIPGEQVQVNGPKGVLPVESMTGNKVYQLHVTEVAVPK